MASCPASSLRGRPKYGYHEEYGFDETFEALVGDILVRFIRKHDPSREHLWIAERDGERVGSIMVVDAGDDVAQLRILLVEPKARGQGIGKRLIDECVDFSRRAGYKKMPWRKDGGAARCRLRSLITKHLRH